MNIKWNFNDPVKLFADFDQDRLETPTRLYLVNEASKYQKVKEAFSQEEKAEFESLFVGFYRVPRGVPKNGEQWKRLFHERYEKYLGTSVGEMAARLKDLFNDAGSKQFSFATKMIALVAETFQGKSEAYPLYDANIAALCGLRAEQMTPEEFCEFYSEWTGICRKIAGEKTKKLREFKKFIFAEDLTDMRALDFVLWYLGGVQRAGEKLKGMERFYREQK